MFEDYLQDSDYFVTEASRVSEDREKKRYYRVAVFCAMAAVEAFANYIAETLAQGNILAPYEIAFLSDKKFGLLYGRFQTLEKTEYSKLEEKLEFLILKFVPDFDFATRPCWSRFHELKKLRDAITHPRQEDDETSVLEYRMKSLSGLKAIIEIMNHLSNGIFKRPLRPRLLDLGTPG